MSYSVTLKRKSRQHPDQSIADFVRNWLDKYGTPPLLAWAEPEPAALNEDGTSGRLQGFRPLVEGTPDWNGLSLVEARLFWQNAALHVLADGSGGCSSVWIEECEEGESMTRVKAPVLTLRDTQRFGQAGTGWAQRKLTAIEYRLAGRLVAWRLVTDKESGNA